MTEKREEYEIYDNETKQAAKVIWHLGYNLDQISNILAVAISTLRTWRTRYKWGKQEPKSRAENMALTWYPDSASHQDAYRAGYKQGQEDCN